jgi:hypothetical protein
MSLLTTSQQIKGLLKPPNLRESHRKILDVVNSRFQSLEDLSDLEEIVEQARRQDEELKHKVGLKFPMYEWPSAFTETSQLSFLYPRRR